MKEKGNIAYKEKSFEKALEFYSKARELDPTDISFIDTGFHHLVP